MISSLPVASPGTQKPLVLLEGRILSRREASQACRGDTGERTQGAAEMPSLGHRGREGLSHRLQAGKGPSVKTLSRPRQNALQEKGQAQTHFIHLVHYSILSYNSPFSLSSVVTEIPC